MKDPMKNIPPCPGDTLLAMNEKILEIKSLALALESEAGQFPGIAKNTRRMLASIKMLELNLCDAVAFDLLDI